MIEMNSFLLGTDDTIVNVVEYAGAPPSHDGGLRVVEARDGFTVGDTYVAPLPPELLTLTQEVTLMRQQLLELRIALGMVV